MNTDLITYYKERAKEYDKIYLNPKRQKYLGRIATILQDIFTEKNVFEIACGTGYWTEKIAQTAASVFATDINKSVIEIAQRRNFENANVTFGLADIYNLNASKKFDGLYGGFIWSHIPLQDISLFLQIVNSMVLPGGIIVFIDNKYMEGSSTPITKTDDYGNTYQIRKLENGSSYHVLKNFPLESFITGTIKGFAKDIKFINLEYYWMVRYKL